MEQLRDILHEAAAPDTSPQRLTRIFNQHRVFAVQRALTANPNTPLELLLRLAQHCPREFAHNPVLELYHLENARFLYPLEKARIHALLTVDDLPDWLWAFLECYAKNHGYFGVRALIATHVRTAPDPGPE